MIFNFKFFKANFSLSVKTRPEQMVFVLQLNNFYCDVTKEEICARKIQPIGFHF